MFYLKLVMQAFLLDSLFVAKYTNSPKNIVQIPKKKIDVVFRRTITFAPLNSHT